MTVTYRPAVLEDAAEITPNLRASDVEELTLSYGPNLEECLRQSIAGSAEVETAEVDGKIIAILGISDAAGKDIGIPWLVCTNEYRQYGRNIFKDSKAHVLRWEKQYKVQVNMVYSKNTTTINWLKRIGYTIGPLHEEWGYAKAPFYQFYRIRKDNV